MFHISRFRFLVMKCSQTGVPQNAKTHSPMTVACHDTWPHKIITPETIVQISGPCILFPFVELWNAFWERTDRIGPSKTFHHKIFNDGSAVSKLSLRIRGLVFKSMFHNFQLLLFINIMRLSPAFLECKYHASTPQMLISRHYTPSKKTDNYETSLQGPVFCLLSCSHSFPNPSWRSPEKISHLNARHHRLNHPNFHKPAHIVLQRRIHGPAVKSLF